MSVLLLLVEALLAPLAALAVVIAFALSPRRLVLTSLAQELPERLGLWSEEARAALAGRRTWWLHAASAGEVAGLVPLIKALAARPNAPALLLTTTTVAGRDAARAVAEISWAQLAPLDAWPFVSRFLAAARPERLLVTETELWPTTLILAAQAGLRPLLINARMTRRSLPLYRFAAPLLRPALDSLDGVLAQSELDAERWRSLGIPPAKITVDGNTKYDRVGAAPAAAAVAAALLRLGWTGKPLFVAGSTHPIEEALLLAALPLDEFPDLRVVIAPRHLERAREAWMDVLRRDPRAARWTQLDRAPEGCRILLLDAMGVLSSLWPHAAAAFVGGTLVPVGGHNLLDPALAGVPVLFGPHTAHIEHPALLLENGGGGRRVRDGTELHEALRDLLRDSMRAGAVGTQARALARQLRGATERVCARLDGAK